MQCFGCGNFFTSHFYEDSLDLCPHCIASSSNQSYMASKEWVQGHIQDDSGNSITFENDSD